MRRRDGCMIRAFLSSTFLYAHEVHGFCLLTLLFQRPSEVPELMVEKNLTVYQCYLHICNRLRGVSGNRFLELRLHLCETPLLQALCMERYRLRASTTTEQCYMSVGSVTWGTWNMLRVQYYIIKCCESNDKDEASTTTKWPLTLKRTTTRTTTTPRTTTMCTKSMIHNIQQHSC